jgi:tRNA (guanosine-2'-O-)-methyltransferase
VRRDTEDATLPGQARDESTWAEPWTATGVVQVLEPLVTDGRRERLQATLASRLDSVTVLMDAPHDPHNAAAILRSCDAFGVQEAHVVLRDEEFLTSRTVAKGAQRWVDVEVHPSADRALSRLHDGGFVLVATHPDGTLTPEALGGIGRLALVLGNEHDGIRQQLAEAARHTVRIPMRGFVESLNVSVAAGILLEAATRGRAGDLPEARRLALYARGLYRTVPRAADILAAHAPR